MFLISSSQENEYSYEYGNPSEGLFTKAYIEMIQKHQTWKSLMEQITLQLHLQTPELSTGQRENIDASFSI